METTDWLPVFGLGLAWTALPSLHEKWITRSLKHAAGMTYWIPGLLDVKKLARNKAKALCPPLAFLVLLSQIVLLLLLLVCLFVLRSFLFVCLLALFCSLFVWGLGGGEGGCSWFLLLEVNFVHKQFSSFSHNMTDLSYQIHWFTKHSLNGLTLLLETFFVGSVSVWLPTDVWNRSLIDPTIPLVLCCSCSTEMAVGAVKKRW